MLIYLSKKKEICWEKKMKNSKIFEIFGKFRNSKKNYNSITFKISQKIEQLQKCSALNAYIVEI